MLEGERGPTTVDHNGVAALILRPCDRFRLVKCSFSLSSESPSSLGLVPRILPQGPCTALGHHDSS